MVKKSVFLTLGAVLPFVFAGCVTIGTPFQSAGVKSIVIGETTQQDIVKGFGTPFRTGVEDGNPTWTYAHYRLGVFGPQQTKDLYIKFDASGKVKSYSFNSNVEDNDEER